MATSHFFNKRVVKLPGVYSAIKSLSGSPSIVTPYGKVLIINTDSSNSFGGSISGELTKGIDSLYRLRNLNEATSLLRSGKLYHITEPLFRPSKSGGVNGISELFYINALTTTAPTITFSFSPAALVLKTKDEGTTSNGVVAEGELRSGYGVQIKGGIRDSAKFIFSFYRGDFKGLAPDGRSYNEIENPKPELILESPEVSTLEQLHDWMKNSTDFMAGFEVSTYTNSSNYTFVSADKTTDYILATGGTSTYNATDLEKVLVALRELDFNVLLFNETLGDSGVNDTIAVRLKYFIQNEVKGEKFLSLAGKSTGSISDLNDNIALAKTFNSDRVWLTHGEVRKNSLFSPIGYRVFKSIYLQALIVGRILGLPPQVPGNFKNLDIDGVVNPLNDLQKEDCLDSGLLTAVYDKELDAMVILRAINTLQDNRSLQNPDGTSFSIQMTRISAQLNSDLVINAKKLIFGNQDGANRFTLSPEYLRDWTDAFLSSKVASNIQDNLIISYGDISVSREGDAYRVNYKFSPNSEIAFVFFTGFALI